MKPVKTHLLLILFLLCSAASFAQYNYSLPLNTKIRHLKRFQAKDLLGKDGGSDGIQVFNNSDDPRGRRFLFDKWVKGSYVETHGGLVNSDSLLYNFDKETGSLIVTTDREEIMKFEIITLNSFTLFNDDKVYFFERPETIDRSKFFQALVKNEDKYSLYKEWKISFEEANYQNNGITETGKKYAEYIDNPQYYLVQPNVRYVEVKLKPKAIKSAFSADDDKVNAYLKQHAKDDVNEAFLIRLVNYLNEP